MKLIKALALLLPIVFFIGCVSPASDPIDPEVSVDAVEDTDDATTEESIENAKKKPGSLIDRYISGEISSD